ncbi:MAG: aminotransferase class I/II-fold pyridoxal phosphate-dependent enzyme [Phycisphaerales bacterium]
MTIQIPAGGPTGRLSISSLISARSRSVDASGIRRVFDLAAKMKDPINLSIGQPDFPVPQAMKDAAKRAIDQDRSGYTVTQGIPELLDAVWRHLAADVGWSGPGEEMSAIVTSGTSGALLLAFMALLDEGDEAIIPDPYFVMYPQLGKLTGGTMVRCDTYPDFRMTAERIERCITPRTKAVLVNSPSNPCGVVLSGRELEEIVDLCRRRGILLISDEIYDEFCFEDVREQGRCPSPARFSQDILLIRGFGKTYGCTGWRMGYCAGPRAIVQEIAKLQQYTFVCAPSVAQWGAVEAFGVDLSPIVQEYSRRRQMVVDAFEGVTTVARPGGAFYAFVDVPKRLGMTGQQFVERAIDHRVLVIPGGVFSSRDTHFRLSFASAPAKLQEGLAILRGMMTA